MKVILLSSVFLLLTGFLSVGQESDENVNVKTIVTDGDHGQKIVQIITSEDSEEGYIQGLVDSLMDQYGSENVVLNVIRIPGMGGISSFNWMEFEGMEELEHIFEMGDNMKWMGVEDIEDLRELQWMEEDKPFLGVIIDTDEKIERGIRIMNIVEESAAAKAGLEKDDILLNIEDHEINSLDDLVDALSEYEIGDDIMLDYLREGTEKKTEAVLMSRAESNYDLAKSFTFNMPSCCEEGKECLHHSGKTYQAFVHKQRPKLGVHIEDLDEEMINDLKISDKKGVLITKVLDETAAKKMGLKINDVILSLNNQEISDVNSLHEVLSRQKLGDEIEISFLRYGLVKTANGVLFEFNHHSALDEQIFFND